MLINIFYIHAQHRMIEVVKRDKNAVFLSAIISWLAQWLYVSIAQKSKWANPKSLTMFMDIGSHSQDCAALKCWRSVFGPATNVPDVSTKLHEAPWRQCKVVLRTVLMRRSNKYFELLLVTLLLLWHDSATMSFLPLLSSVGGLQCQTTAVCLLLFQEHNWVIVRSYHAKGCCEKIHPVHKGTALSKQKTDSRNKIHWTRTFPYFDHHKNWAAILSSKT